MPALGLRSQNVGNQENVRGIVKKERSARNALGDISNNHAGLGFGKSKGKYGKLSQNIKVVDQIAQSPVVRKRSKKNLSVLESKFGKSERLPIDAADIEDFYNPRYAAEYISDVVSHYDALQKEKEFQVDADYMSRQKDINAKMRELLVDWLSQVHTRFQLSSPTFYLGINLLDRFLSGVNVKRDKLQLVGCATLWLAAKYEEIFAPEIDDFVTISDNSFSYDDMLKSEKFILEALEYQLGGPTIYVFLRRYLKILGCSVRLQHIAGFLVEFLQQRMEILKFSHSILAASVLWFAVLVEKYNLEENKENMQSPASLKDDDDYEYVWDENMERITGHSEADLLPSMSVVRKLVLANKDSSNKAVAKKYSAEKYHNVSKFEFDIDLPGEDQMEESN